MDTLSYRSKTVKPADANIKWYVVDAENEIVGRLGSRIASVLRGKNKPSFTPNMDTGDYVIVINADKVRFTGKKMQQKVYLSYSLYPGGQKSRTASDLRATKPKAIIEKAVKGMLPHNKLGDQMIKKLFVYEGAEHPHAAQKPEPFKF